MIDEQLLATWVERLRNEEPGAIAVLLTGSYARGEAGPHSDLDLLVLTRGDPLISYRTWLVERENGWLLHISAGADSWDEWLSERGEPADWAFRLPAREEARLLWAADSVREELRVPSLVHPPGTGELEDFVECFGKVKNAALVGGELCVRLAARDLADYCPAILAPLNPAVEVRSRCEALWAALSLPMAPARYREDLLVCAGLSGRATTAREVYESAARLVTGVIELLQSHAARLSTELQPELPRYLANGTLHRYVTQGEETAR